MALDIFDPPQTTEFLERDRQTKRLTGTVQLVWNRWFNSLVTRLQAAAYVVASVALAGQGAAIPATPLVPSASGLYRVSWTTRVTTVAAVSSAVTVVVSYTSGAVAVGQTGAANTSNLTTAPLSGQFLVQCDPNTPLSYSTTYASNAAGQMVYEISIHAERLG